MADCMRQSSRQAINLSFPNYKAWGSSVNKEMAIFFTHSSIIYNHLII